MSSNGFEQWGGYMDAKITKLEEQFSAASNPYRKSNLFAGISIFVNGLTDPSADELKRIMMVHGGTYHHYERSHTKFIIASNLPDVKVRNMKTSNIVSPQWIVDCVRGERILDYSNYLLYTNKKTSQPRIMFKNHKKEDSVDTASSLNMSKSELPSQTEVVNKNQSTTQTTTPQSNTTSASTSNVARTAVDPKFLSEFYNNSRLHHIATLGAGFKQYVTELRENHGGRGFPARELLKARLVAQTTEEALEIKTDTCIMHIDMDCFFVSVGLRKHPELRGQPIAVTHSKGGSSAHDVRVHPSADRELEKELYAKRFEQHLHNNILSDKVRVGFDSKMSLSEIASCSYEARAKGLHNGMFVGQAMKLCPDLKTIPYDFDGYREVAYTLYDTIAQYTLNIEAVSCDEMFVDLTDVLTDLKVAPMSFVQAIRQEVREKTGCPCSAGVGANKLQARMATKRAKPDGQFHLLAADVQKYMADIPIDELPGVGSSISYSLRELNLLTCGDLQNVSLVKLQMHVGKKLGETLYKFCRGNDDRSLIYEKLRKSVSAEVNYGIRFREYSELETFIRQLSTEVHTRLSDIKRRTKCITLKLMVRSKEAPIEAAKFMGHGVCDNITKSVSLSEFTCELETITRTVLTTMKALAVPPNELRGIGITLSKLDDPNEGKERKENVIKNMFNKVMEKQKEKNPEIIEDNGSLEKHNNMPLNKTIVKKSPKKDHSKSNRGRNQPKPTSNVLAMLQVAAEKRQASDLNSFNEESSLPPDIDPEVFAALPPDIRAEILNGYVKEKASVQKNDVHFYEGEKQPSTSKKALQKLQENPALMCTKKRKMNEAGEHLIASPAKKSKDLSTDNIFMLPNCVSLLLHWVKSDREPENEDVELIANHGCELVHADEIYVLYSPLVYLCRLINQHRGNTEYCNWHIAYRKIIKNIQSAMQIFYNGQKLLITEKIKCDKCKMPEV